MVFDTVSGYEFDTLWIWGYDSIWFCSVFDMVWVLVWIWFWNVLDVILIWFWYGSGTERLFGNAYTVGQKALPCWSPLVFAIKDERSQSSSGLDHPLMPVGSRHVREGLPIWGAGILQAKDQSAPFHVNLLEGQMNGKTVKTSYLAIAPVSHCNMILELLKRVDAPRYSWSDCARLMPRQQTPNRILAAHTCSGFGSCRVVQLVWLSRLSHVLFPFWNVWCI